MGIVHKHKRRTASGKVATVRQHTRDTDGGGGGNERRPAAEDAALPPSAAAVQPVAPREDTETWWDEEDNPRPEPWMDAGDDDEWHERLRRLRESGYEGPVDHHGNPTDRKAAIKAARHRLGVARQTLAENQEWEISQGIDWETPRYERLNHEYNEALKGVAEARRRV